MRDHVPDTARPRAALCRWALVVSLSAATFTASTPALASGGVPGFEYIVGGSAILVAGAAIGFGAANLVSVAQGRRSSDVTLALGYTTGGLTVLVGSWALASSTGSEDATAYVGGAGIALGALSIGAAIWAHTQPETPPRSTQWTLAPWVASGARGERVLGAGLTLRAW